MTPLQAALLIITVLSAAPLAIAIAVTRRTGER
jgi:hypothetical protein